MAVIPIGDGKGITWEPTTELICTKCREVFAPKSSLQTVYLLTNAAHGGLAPDVIHDYWYLHQHCLSIEKVLKEMGANIRWIKYDMPHILGFMIEKDGYRRPLNRKHVEERFPPGIWKSIVEQWRPALGGLDSRVTETIDITSIDLDETVDPLEPLSRGTGLSLRFDILKRDSYRCRLCGIAASDSNDVRLEVDHKIPRAKGGKDHPDNLWTLCFACNRGKRTKDVEIASQPAPAALIDMNPFFTYTSTDALNSPTYKILCSRIVETIAQAIIRRDPCLEIFAQNMLKNDFWHKVYFFTDDGVFKSDTANEYVEMKPMAHFLCKKEKLQPVTLDALMQNWQQYGLYEDNRPIGRQFLALWQQASEGVHTL